MRDRTVHIGELHLRVPNLGVEEARRMAEGVAQRVAHSLPVRGQVEQLGAVDLRLSLPHGAQIDLFAKYIANAILEMLR